MRALLAASILACVWHAQAASVVTTIVSKELWNEVAIPVTKGRSYELSSPAGQQWIDWYVKTGPEGYDGWWMRAFDSLKRVPGLNYFRLVCCYERHESTCFDVGSQLKLEATRSSPSLFCFANDVPFMYWNNYGQVSLAVAEMA